MYVVVCESRRGDANAMFGRPVPFHFISCKMIGILDCRMNDNMDDCYDCKMDTAFVHLFCGFPRPHAGGAQQQQGTDGWRLCLGCLSETLGFHTIG